MDYRNNLRVSVRNNRTRLVHRTYGVPLTTRKKNNYDPAQYEGKLVRVDRNRVYYIKDGKEQYVPSLAKDGQTPTIIDGKPFTWSNVNEVTSGSGSQGLLKKLTNKVISQSLKPLTDATKNTSLGEGLEQIRRDTLTKAPANLAKGLGAGAAIVGAGTLLGGTASPPSPTTINTAGMAVIKDDPSNPLNLIKKTTSNIFTTPSDAEIMGITNAVKTGSGNSSSLINQVLNAAGNIAKDPTKLNDVLTKGTNLVNNGKGVLTKAQQQLKQLSTDAGLLPKTKSLKQAEQLLTLPQSDGTAAATMSMPPYMKWGLIGLAVAAVGFVIYKTMA